MITHVICPFFCTRLHACAGDCQRCTLNYLYDNVSISLDMINDTNSIIDINVHIIIFVNKVSHLDNVFRKLMKGWTSVTRILLMRTRHDRN